MVRVLIIITITAFLLSVVSLSAAAAIGRHDLAARGWSWNKWEIDFDDEARGVHIHSHHGQPRKEPQR